MNIKHEFIGIRFILTLMVCVIFGAVSVVFPAYSGEMINSVMLEAGNIWTYILFFIGIGLLQYFLSVLWQISDGCFQSFQKRQMRSKAFAYYLRETENDKEKRAVAVSFINNDIPVIVSDYYMGYINLVGLFTVIGLSVSALLVIHWSLAVIIVVSSLLILFIPHAHKKKSADARISYSASLSVYNTSLISFLEGINVIKLFKYSDRANRREESENKIIEKAEIKVLGYQWLVYNWTALVQIAKNVLLLVVGVLLINSGNILIGDLVAVIQISALIAAPIETIAYVIQSMNAARPLRNRYVEMLHTQQNIRRNDATMEENPIIEIKDLSYEAGGITILKDINMSFSGKKKYLLMGESGSGKSTLLRLIAGLGDLNYKGRITYNGKDIKDISEDSYYSILTMTFQEPYLFNATLKENILLGRECNEHEYEEVLDRLNLRYLIERYGNKEIDATSMERLSGGEKQRVVLARALIGNPSIYLFDEVTSSLDEQNANLIEHVLTGLDAMVIHVSHRVDSERKKLYDEVRYLSS